MNVIVFAQSNFNPTFSVETNSGKTYGVKITHNLNIINGGYYDLNVLVDDTTPMDWISTVLSGDDTTFSMTHQ